MRSGLVAAVILVVLAAGASAAPTWLAPFSPLPSSTSFMQLAMNGRGEILFADRIDLPGGTAAFRVAARAPGAATGAPVQIPSTGVTGLPPAPSLALADDGHAILAWARGGSAFYALRAPSGAWAAPLTVPGATNVTNVSAAIDATGVGTLGWAQNTNPAPSMGTTNDASVKVVRIAPSGTTSGSQTLLSQPASSEDAGIGTLRVTPSGRAVFAYGLANFVFFFFSPTVAFRDSAAGAFGDAVDLPGSFSGFPPVDVGDGGRAVLAQAAGASVAMRVREPGGALGGAVNVPAGGDVTNVRARVAAGGAITLVWDIQLGGDPRVMACTATPTDCVGAPQRLSTPEQSLNLSDVAVNPAGAALVVWNANQTSPSAVSRSKAALRPSPGAAFGAAREIAPPPARFAQVALDAAGNGVATFDAATGSATVSKAVGFDATGPRIDALSAPATTVQGASAAFSAHASDVWSPFTLSWSFGDGATASGAQVSHAFSGSGAFLVTVTATDAVGNRSSRSATVTVRDTTRPRIKRLTISHRRFRVGSKPTARTAGRRAKRVPTGTAFRYRLSEAGSARFRIDRVLAGRRVGRVCARATRANRGHRACKRSMRAGTLTRRAAAGANVLAFSGRIGRKPLAPGSYRMTLTVVDAAGNRSKARAVTFTVVGGG